MSYSRIEKRRYAHKASKHGAHRARLILDEADRTGIMLSLGLALVEQESGFQNVFGHDGVRNPVRGGPVTKDRYLAYKHYRKAGYGMQGVGLTQLTWYSFQDRADALGGCWKPRWQLRVGFEVLAANIRQHGQHAGIAAYNGSGPAAQHYADQVIARQRAWHAVLVA
ncbi:MAG: hypothetical protein QOG26_763 [Solirubrobacterales bacterium]|jgi:hypothetical protein|nr:hypothetical protein [Solirubrobacterales bacterium]